MELDRYNETELVKIAKFKFSQLLMSATLLHRDTFDILFQYTSPMKQVNKDILDAAIAQAKKIDIYFGDVRFSSQGGFTTIFSEGNYSRVIVILFVEQIESFIKKYLPAILKEFLDEYENKYFQVLKLWREKPDLAALKGTEELLDKVSSMKLNLPHQAKYQGYTPDSLTDKTVFEAADQVTRKLGYFYLGNLIFLTKQYVINKELDKQRSEEAKKGKKKDEKKKKKKDRDDKEIATLENPADIQFPPDEDFYISMFNLKNRGLLQPIDINELDSFSKVSYKRASQKRTTPPAEIPAPVSAKILSQPPVTEGGKSGNIITAKGEIICANCKCLNPPGSTSCEECGESL